MGTRPGEVEARRERVDDEAEHVALVGDADGAASSEGRDPVQRDDSNVEDRLDPVPRDALEWDIEFGLWKARKLLPRKVGPGVFNPYKSAAQAVVEHIERCGIRCFRKPPRPLAQSGEGPAGRSRSSTRYAEGDGERGTGEAQG